MNDLESALSLSDAVTRRRRAAWFAGTALCLGALLGSAEEPAVGQSAPSPAQGSCRQSDAELTLPPGFCASVFADGLGHARHLVVGPNGIVYVNTWSGRYYGNDKPPAGGFLVALIDRTGDGRADKVVRFGEDASAGNAGGTGIALYNGGLYAETNDKIVRYELPADAIPTGSPSVIVSGLPLSGDHPMHPFVIDRQGQLFVDLGSITNSCQVENRTLQSPGIAPCTELETRAGIWRYDANRKDQHFSPAERFATGLRNGEGLAFDSDGRLFATQHGRDQLSQNWPEFYTAQQGANEPAEELVQVEQGADFGWPYCYFDLSRQQLMLAPEYGGDGKTVGPCTDKRAPVAAFPAHWAPNDLAIYDGQQFPAPYRGGAFIAFHGSWNRAPLPQGGYSIVFQPMKDGKAAGPYVLFADGFAGGHEDPGAAAHRPSGVAIGPDGALYISDDQRGRIWRVTYHGPATASLQSAPPASALASANPALPPEGIHPDAGRAADQTLPVPPGATETDVALGNRIYHGEVAGASCAGCHGAQAKGTPLAPDLTMNHWLWGDGSLASIMDIVARGVPNPKQYRDAMPPMGGAQLSPMQVKAVASYVWAISHMRG